MADSSGSDNEVNDEFDAKKSGPNAGAPDESRLSEFKEDDDTIDITHARLDKLPNLEKYTKLRSLCIRENHIKKIENIETITQDLEELDMYDNLLTAIENLERLLNLKTLDLSFNKIKQIQNIEELVNLRKLYIINNKVSKIQNISTLVNLTVLELGSNRICKIENLETLVNLTELYLGRNKITKLENLDACKQLRLISIQSNRIVKLEGLDSLEALEELYISHNGITIIEGLEKNTRLTTLDLGNNMIQTIENIGHLNALEEFWFNDNKCENWKDIDGLAAFPKLETVYMERNPLHSNDVGAYRRKMMLALPRLKQLDATMTSGASF